KYLKNQMKIKKKLPFVRWEMNQRNDKLPLKSTGTPYIWVGTKNYICHQGKDKNIRRKEKLKGQAAANFASKGDHPQCSKVRRNIRPTKKKHCSVSFVVKKLFLFLNMPLPKTPSPIEQKLLICLKRSWVKLSQPTIKMKCVQRNFLH
uniref:Uncharacterized protein n=1 Tax=Clytia hemisphaerica TaxID=252671 RepID=A0A7M5V8W2_9CNID